MTALLIEYFKLIVLFTFIASVIGFSHFSGGKAKRARRKVRCRHGRIVPVGR
jgi:hypothetical protein